MVFGAGKVSHQESGARVKAPQRNAIAGLGDRKAIEIPVVLIPQAESLSVNSQFDMFQRVSLFPETRNCFGSRRRRRKMRAAQASEAT
jgi:hypothetical protein